MAALLGDDGLGYDLARRLEACGVWRPWLGDACYANFIHFLASPSSWESFMRVDDAKSRAQIHLQLRARALLFDKASVSLFLRPQSSSSSSSSAIDVPKLNPAYLQLHGDDVYYTLENGSQEGASAPSKIQSKAAFSVGSRYGESDFDNISDRFRHDDLPESWYTQFIERYRNSRPYRLSSGDREIDKRTPEEMAAYRRHCEKHKRRRAALTDDRYMGFGNFNPEDKLESNSNLDTISPASDDIHFFPETMYTWNCVPERALPLRASSAEENQKVEFFGVLDTLPMVVTKKSTIMIERLGIRPEYLAVEQGGNLFRGKNGSEGNIKHLGQDQASQLSKKVLARMLIKLGFEGATEVPLDVLSQLLSCHICKLGRTLKVLADSYRKQCSAMELVRMFLQTAGHGNLGALSELVKESSRTAMQQNQPQLQGFQPQLQQQQQHQSPVLQTQQVLKQVHPQMQPMLHPPIQQQQQLERIRRRQASTPRPSMNIDKDRQMVQVKIEAPSELPVDSNSYNAMSARTSQIQIRQQQLPAMPNFQAQVMNQFRQLSSLQAPQIQTQLVGTVRAPPVKVEGFQELMGGDSSSKHDLEENRLTSPSK